MDLLLKIHTIPRPGRNIVNISAFYYFGTKDTKDGWWNWRLKTFITASKYTAACLYAVYQSPSTEYCIVWLKGR